MDKDNFLARLEATIEPVQQDRRDKWPMTYSQNYQRQELLFRGRFSSVHVARFTRKAGTMEEKSCITKSRYIGQIFDYIKRQGSEDAECLTSYIAKNILVELLVLTRLRHRNIMHAHLVQLIRDDLVIAMPRLYNLFTLVEKYQRLHYDDPLSISIIAPIVRQICSGLAFLHCIPIIHRKINPRSVFLTRGGTVKLGCFGSARLLPKDEKCHLPPTAVYPEFMSPEVRLATRNLKKGAETARSYSVSSDIWSVGVLILHMISFFPEEKCRRLAPNFADIMMEKHMPFHYLINKMMVFFVLMTTCNNFNFASVL
ncbi:hypothetical protein L596_004239 [Steinernema carpocapsae]|uniref:Protein kinase domain-containing protein n=1 Tax=Steinernema carpocapsae TaxID=34508 RepID=A0A4U8UWT9_STECR|nr:hypothetical protein L596_004239 [Steinernema carpocapsae]